MNDKPNLGHIDAGKTTISPEILNHTSTPAATLVPCSCGCGADVPVDGLGSALSGSMKGMKIFFASKNCQLSYKEKNPDCTI